MIIHFKQLNEKKNDVALEKLIDLSELLTSRQDIESVEAVKVSCVAEAAGNKVIVAGHGVITVEFICSRCLRHFKQTLDIPFKEAFSRDVDVVEADEEGETHLVTEDYIDLQPHIEENIVLGLPFVPICKRDCQGLCVHCGQDKNKQSCDCQDNVIDPRLEGLKAFFD